MVKQGYKQTEIGVIPEDWSVNELESIVQFCTKTVPVDSINITSYVGTENMIANIGGVTKNFLQINYKNIREYLKNDILLSNIRPYLKKIWLSTRHGGCSNDVLVLRNIQADMHFHQYIFFALSKESFFDYVMENAVGTKMPRGDKQIIKTYKLLTPPITEQKHIAEALSDVDNMISALEKLIAKKKAVKQGAMQELLTGKKRLPGFAGEWKEKQIGAYGDFVSGNGFPLKYQGNPSGLYPFYKVSDFNNVGNSREMIKANNYISDDVANILSCNIIPKQSIVFAKIGAAIALERKRITSCVCCIDNNMMSFQPYEKETAQFMCYLFQTIRFGELVEATALPSLSGKTIGEIKKIFPPTSEEQIAISSILSDMDNEIEALEWKLEKTRQIKQGMMQQLLTGKIRLTEEAVATSVVENNDQVATSKTQTNHNHQFDDAVMIAAVVNSFYSPKYRLGRKKVQKLLYLLRRKQEADTSAFKKKAAGPYADEVRYKGGEPIAKHNGYIETKKNNKGTLFFIGPKMASALEYIAKWQMQDSMDWLVKTFKYIGVEELELLATVDMAMCDLVHAGIEVSVDSIKQLIRSNEEWKAKLKKVTFSDDAIARAIEKCRELFGY